MGYMIILGLFERKQIKNYFDGNGKVKLQRESINNPHMFSTTEGNRHSINNESLELNRNGSNKLKEIERYS